MLRDGMCFHADDFAAINARCCPVTDALLVPLNALLVNDSAGSNGDMITLGEHPCIEVWRNIVSHIHLSTVLVVVHLVFRDLHALLECDRVLVIAGLDVLGNTAVCAISADHNIHLQSFLLSLARIAFRLVIVVEGQHVRFVFLLRQGHAHEESVDQGCTVLLCSLPKEVIKHLPANHTNELIILQCLPNLDFLVRGRDHGHLSHLTVHNVFRQAKLINHAERDSTPARLAVVQLALNQVGLNAFLGQCVRCACSSRTSSDHSYAQLAAFGEGRASTNHNFCVCQRSRLLLHLGRIAALGQGRTVLAPAARRTNCTQGCNSCHSGARGSGWG
mmetsp:Transcript_68929/g.162082  ORF Transcript_68929/g.162082 Transcript_68929/m.162082 type:complete len:332 (-) Transcript_68929:159-1154(-)